MKNPPVDPSFKKIKTVLKFVWNNPYSSFYRDKYSKVGINLVKDIKTWEDFNKLPFLTREEISKVDPYDRFYFPKEQIGGSTHSSSTTGETGVLIMLKANIKRPISPQAIKKALDLKIKSVMILTYPTALWAVLNRPLFNHKSIVHYTGNVYNLPNTAKVIKGVRIEALATTPSILERLTPLLVKEEGYRQIKYIALFGESCSPLRLKYFKRIFKDAYFRASYSSVESGGIGEQCEYLAGNLPQFFHPLPKLLYEINNPDKESELILTHLTTKTEFPLIRYRTGDMVKIMLEDCLCGQNKKMKILGRIGKDVVRIKGRYLYREQIDQALFPFGKYLGYFGWKLVISRSKFQLQLILKPEIKIKHADIKAILEKGISGQLDLPLEIKIVDSFDNFIKQKSIVYE